MQLGCWKWFNAILEEAGVEVTDENSEKIEDVIHQYIGEKSKYGRCSSDWRKARKEIKVNDGLRLELIERVRKIS
jgi:hypothetical protein